MTGALSGIRITDLTQLIGGPFCTQMLADLGADVIKIEDPISAARQRMGIGPTVEGRDGRSVAVNGVFLNHNRNKRSILLDLRKPEAMAVLRDLVAKSDVVVENFGEHARQSLGITEAWGFAIRSDLIWASLTAMGRTGPDYERGGYDMLEQARGGFLSITGEPDGPPMKAGNSMVDYYGGLHLTIGVLAALRHRDLTGTGQTVDISLLESLMPCLDGFPLWYSIGGAVPQRHGNFHASRMPGLSLFECTDGYIVPGAPPGPIWDRFMGAIGRPDLAGGPSSVDVERWAAFSEETVAAIRAWASTYTRAEAGEILDRHRVPNEPVRTLAEVWSDRQLEARGMFLEYEYGPIGRIKTIGSPIHLSETPVEFRYPPPEPGEHSWEILRDVLGYDQERAAQLAIAGALGGAAG